MTLPRRGLLIGAAAAAGVGGAGWIGWRQMGTARDIADLAARQRRTLPPSPPAYDLIRHATLAASGHNTQAWRFRETAAGFDLLPDLSRRTPIVDPDDHHLFVNLGCAAENLSLAMAAQGRGGEITVTLDGTVHLAYGTFHSPDPALFDAIALRQSTRSDHDGSRVIGSDFLFWSAMHVAPNRVIATVLATPPGLVAAASLAEQGRINAMLDAILPVSARAAGLRAGMAAGKRMTPVDLTLVRASTLLISARDDGYGTYAAAEYMASQITGARFLGFETGGHTWIGHNGAVMDAIHDLLFLQAGVPVH